jgi:hypothetical protein
VSTSEHELHDAVHDVSQQMPPTHCPCRHSLFARHAAPSIFFAAQVMAGAQYPLVQSPSVEQAVAHPPAAEHANPLQS